MSGSISIRNDSSSSADIFWYVGGSGNRPDNAKEGVRYAANSSSVIVFINNVMERVGEMREHTMRHESFETVVRVYNGV